MGPGWAYLSGQILDVDIISEYGIGIIAVISRLAQLSGGFSYEHVIGIMVMGNAHIIWPGIFFSVNGWDRWCWPWL